MNAPIYDAIIEHNKKHRSAFHMPAHKGRADCLAPLGDALKLDMTEIPDTGSLFDGEGATAQAERLATELFGTAGSFMSAGGCTLCIQAMLRLVLPQGGTIICGRVIHRAAVNAMALLNITPVWVMPDGSAGAEFTGRITAESVGEALGQNPDAKAVYITTPDYFGVMSDIAAISVQAKKHGIPVIVDNAHGAHLQFIDPSLSPLARGAALSADSAHKTLPVLTGGAWLNIADEGYLAGARAALALFGSTSPSYLIMLSLDLCRAWLAQNGAVAMKKLVAHTERIKQSAQEKGFVFPQGECDPLRLAFNTTAVGLSGDKAGQILRNNHIEPEYAGREGLILIPSPFNTQEDFERLKMALGKMSGHFTARGSTPTEVIPPAQQPAMVLTPRQALMAENVVLPVTKSIGRIACSAVCPCPPAIPIVMPGEVITPQSATLLAMHGYSNINVVK